MYTPQDDRIRKRVPDLPIHCAALHNYVLSNKCVCISLYMQLCTYIAYIIRRVTKL